ncbi:MULTISPECIES: hypothetical protein [unclassified Crossiella]|uniref:hypothetical protein n=1 Tax=unclassified Crossiella TaxID=2620835 RepID=UPI001FFE8F8D|nr:MULTISPECIES: hypothetical protein [unclassified Crossiella]MCK2245280.1 hypothetical protein [Crossiella sp. S99.2]MCK2258932.1 hypothetical protein [Crossiella sp. S99.1]
MTRGRLVAGPLLYRRNLARLPLVAGPLLVRAELTGIPFLDYQLQVGPDILSAIYLITDLQERVVWLGQASRVGGLLARLAQHERFAVRRRTFARLRYLHLHDHIAHAALDAIEGRCCDILGLRGTMGSRRWPSARGWPEDIAVPPQPAEPPPAVAS